MKNMDYSYFKKTRYNHVEDLAGLPEYDCLISAYVDVERVKEPSGKIPCKEKWWVLEDGVYPDGFVRDARTFHITEESDGGITNELVEKG